MDNKISDVINDFSNVSSKAFELMTRNIEQLGFSIARGSFQFPGGKEEIDSLKSSFCELFDLLKRDSIISDLYLEGHGLLNSLELDSKSDFALMQSIYQLIKSYFDSLVKRQENQDKVNKEIVENLSEEIVENNEIIKEEKKELDVLTKINYWDETSKLFGLSDLSEDNCYEIFDKFDFLKLNKGKFDLILQNLKDILKTKNSKDEEFKDFLKFLIRIMNDYSKNYFEINEIKIEEEKLKKVKLLLEKSFVSGLSYFNNFFVVFESYQNNYSNIKNFSSFDELKNKPNLLNSFNELREGFCSEYVKIIQNNYYSIFKESGLDQKHYYSILKEIDDIFKIYYISNMTNERFFVAFKRGFLIGDIYEFLSKKRKEFPSFAENTDEYILEKINEYESK